MTKMRIFLFLFMILCFGAAMCACTGPDPSVPETSTLDSLTPETSTEASMEQPALDEWDMMSYAELDDIISIKEVDDQRPDVNTWRINFSNDGINVYAYISIPDKVLEERIPYSCVVYARGGNQNLGSVTPRELSGYAISFNSVVVATEYRGTYYGTGQDGYGGVEVYDILKLIDYCEELAFIDMDRLYMMGVSRGGMMTYMVIREDERINKAFITSGTTDVFVSYEDREDMRNLLENLIGGTPDTLPEEYEKRSATCWADEIKCPVLLFHSKLDTRVSYAQATKLVAALEAAGKEYKFVSYEDDTHGLHTEDLGIILEWCDFGPKFS